MVPPVSYRWRPGTNFIIGKRVKSCLTVSAAKLILLLSVYDLESNNAIQKATLIISYLYLKSSVFIPCPILEKACTCGSLKG